MPVDSNRSVARCPSPTKRPKSDVRLARTRPRFLWHVSLKVAGFAVSPLIRSLRRANRDLASFVDLATMMRVQADSRQTD